MKPSYSVLVGYRIFVVEDHPIMRRAYAAMLALEPDLTLCGMAESAEEALETLTETACDLVVVDVALPGMDGIELTEALLKEYPDLLILVISGHDEAVLGARARRAGARGYLNKWGLQETLIGTIRKTLLGSASPGQQDRTFRGGPA